MTDASVALTRWFEFLHKSLWLAPPAAVLLTFACLERGLALELGALVTIFFAGIFFAFAITMNTANMRRFDALNDIALLKSIFLSLWQSTRSLLPDDQRESLQRSLTSFFGHLQEFLELDSGTQQSRENLARIDHFFCRLAALAQELRAAGMSTPELSRVLQWHQQGYLAFERLLAVKENRSPITLRLFMTLTLVVALFLLAPQFANLGYFGVASSGIVSVVMVALIKIQYQLENPFGTNADDIVFRFSERLSDRLE